jgi:co-chaperonin GroES (HSP10)
MPVGDLAGSSPAGISVTALGQMAVTGAAGRSALVDKVAVTDAVGRFAFMGLSSGNVQLAFSRGDGISAHVTVSASVAAVVVDLQKNQATIHGGGQSTRELEGLITAISDTSISVNDASSGPQTAVITPTTVIRKGNTTLTPADLKVGDRVHVKASVGADGTLTAFEIMLQNGDTTGGQTKELEGLITAVSDTSITVMNASTAKPETAAITPTTVIRKGNTTLTAADLKVGDRVHVKTTTNTDGTLTATEILLQNPA